MVIVYRGYGSLFSSLTDEDADSSNFSFSAFALFFSGRIFEADQGTVSFKEPAQQTSILKVRRMV